VLALALLPGVACAARNPTDGRSGHALVARRILPVGRDAWFFTALTTVGLGAFYLGGWTNSAHVGPVARLLPLAVVGLSVLWPHANVLRYSLLLAVGTLIGTAVTPTAAPWAVGVALAAIALGAVATNRLAASASPRLGPHPRPKGSRLAAEAVAVLVLVGIVAAIAATLVPPPPGRGGADPKGRLGNMNDAAPAFGFDDRLDIGAGRGRRTNKVLFRVAADGPDLWRAITYDHWDGQNWARSPDEAGGQNSTVPPEGGQNSTVPPEGGQNSTVPPSGGQNSTVPPGIGDPGDAAAADGEGDFVQRITIEARAASVLVAAARPVHVALPRGVAQVGDDASLRPPYTLIRGQRYVVSSTRSVPGPMALDALGDITSGVPADVADRYLQLPEIPAALRALAADISASAPTTYAKVRSIEGWLDANVRATDAARPVPPGADPLEQVLLVDRAGPPERISAAFAVMLRALGIPSRLAVGYLPGTRTGLSGDFTVRGSDTHAWVEVWFPGTAAGWQRFDPTGKAPTPGARDDSLRARLMRLLAQLWPLLVVAVLALAGWLTWRGERWRRRRAARPWATRFLARLERAGAARGRPKRAEETPKEYAAGLSRSVLPDPRLEEVGDLVTVAAYAREEPATSDKARAEEVLRQATKAAPARRLRPRARAARAEREAPTRSRPPQGPRIPEP